MEVPREDFSVEVDPPVESEAIPEVVPKMIPRPVVLHPLNKPLADKPLADKPLADKPLADKPVVNTPLVETSIEEKPVAETKLPVAETKLPASGMAETIEMEHPQLIFPHIEPYPETSPKQHHFHFKHKSDHATMMNAWSPMGITVEFNESGKNNVDVTLMKDGSLIGKLQFLHFDRRDRSNRSKHYVKIYLYQFEDPILFEKAKEIIRSVFTQIGSRPRSVRRSSHRSVKKSKRPHKKTRKHHRR